MIISIGALSNWLANAIAQSGIVGKLFAWISTIGVTTLMVYGFWFGRAIKKTVKIVITCFIILTALAFANQAGMLPTWMPVVVTW